jgi:hypothetical protein
MPILVACDCGKRFAAREHLFGRQVSCPACGNFFTVSTAGKHAVRGIFVTCGCGLAFHASESMRGQQARCRGCGRLLLVGGPDPLGVVSSEGAGELLLPAVALPGLPPADEDEIPWLTLKRIGLVGAFALAAVVIVTTFVQHVVPLITGR